MANTSQRLAAVPASPIRKLVPLADAAKSRGITVYHLNIGDPDIPTPQVMVDVLKNWDVNPIGYAHSQGDKRLVEALVGYYRGLGYGFIENSHVQVCVGGSEALAMAFFATCEAGDEVLVFEPFFTGYASLAPLYGVILKPVTTTIAAGFHLPDRATIEAQMTPRTKAILITNPNNPTGTVYSREEIEMIVGIARDRGVWVLADEVYREQVFDGKQQVSLLDYMQQLPDRLVVLDSLSKRYSACGLRIGALVSLNQELMAGVLRFAMGRLSAGLIDQAVAAALTQVSREEILAVRDEYQRRRDVIYEGLARIPGLTIQKPEGAFYAVVGLPVPDAEAFCSWLLTDFNDNNETVMLAPVAGFYTTPGLGQNEVRIAYVLNTDKLRRSVEILAHALQTYPGNRLRAVSTMLG